MKAVDGRGGGAGGHVNAASPGVLAGPLPSLEAQTFPPLLAFYRERAPIATLLSAKNAGLTMMMMMMMSDVRWVIRILVFRTRL